MAGDSFASAMMPTAASAGSESAGGSTNPDVQKYTPEAVTYALSKIGVKGTPTADQIATANMLLDDTLDFQTRYGVLDGVTKDDTQGSHRHTYGIDLGMLITAMATRSGNGTFSGRELPGNVYDALNYTVKNYGTKVTQLPAGSAIDNLQKKNYGLEGEIYGTGVSRAGAGNSATLWRKESDGTFTNLGVFFDDDSKIHNNGFGAMLAGVGLSLLIGPAGMGLTGAGATGAAIAGAAGGAVSSAITGGNVLKGAVLGGVGGYVSGATSNALSGAVKAGTISQVGANAIGAGVGGTATSLLRGQSIGDSLKSGVISGAAGYVGGTAGQAAGGGKIGGLIGGVVGGTTSAVLRNALSPSGSTSVRAANAAVDAAGGAASGFGSALIKGQKLNVGWTGG